MFRYHWKLDDLEIEAVYDFYILFSLSFLHFSEAPEGHGPHFETPCASVPVWHRRYCVCVQLYTQMLRMWDGSKDWTTRTTSDSQESPQQVIYIVIFSLCPRCPTHQAKAGAECDAHNITRAQLGQNITNCSTFSTFGVCVGGGGSYGAIFIFLKLRSRNSTGALLDHRLQYISCHTTITTERETKLHTEPKHTCSIEHGGRKYDFSLIICFVQVCGTSRQTTNHNGWLVFTIS